MDRIVRDALDAIVATDETPFPDDEGEIIEEQEGIEGARGGPSGASKRQMRRKRRMRNPESWRQWEEFSKRVSEDPASVSCVVDVANGGRLRVESNLERLERVYFFHDALLGVVAVHAHTTALWKERERKGASWPLRTITLVTAQYAREELQEQKNATTTQEQKNATTKCNNELFLVPKSKKMQQDWRSLPESDVVWELDDGSVPLCDKEFAGSYESVREVLKVGEKFCVTKKKLIRGTMKRGGQEVEYIAFATRTPLTDLAMAAVHTSSPAPRRLVEDPAAMVEDPAAKLRAAVLCIGLGKYKHLTHLPNATRDAQALCEKVNALPDCKAQLLVEGLHDSKSIENIS